jgi:hypothetical protein
MSEQDRVAALRRRWFGNWPVGDDVGLCVVEPEPTVTAPAARCADATDEGSRETGFHYQRCGGGRRVIHKRIGSN